MSSIKTLIDAYIKANNAQEITGPVLNGVLTAIANALETPYIGDDGYWYEYDTETGQFVPTTTKAQGPSGVDTANAILVEGGSTPDVQVFYDPDLRQLDFNFYNLKGDKGDTGDPGVIGAYATVDANVGTPSVDTSLVSGLLELDFHNLRGAAAGFGTPTITVGANQGTPTASVTASGPDTAKVFAFAFDGLKGETGPQGPQGPQGNPGSSVAYPFTLANNLTTDDSTVALTAAMGVQLKGEISQLSQEVDGLSNIIGTVRDENIDLTQYTRLPYFVNSSGLWADVPDANEQATILVPVSPGTYKIKTGATQNIWVALENTNLVSGAAVPFGTVNGVQQTSRQTVAADTEFEVVITENDTTHYLALRADRTSGAVLPAYMVKVGGDVELNVVTTDVFAGLEERVEEVESHFIDAFCALDLSSIFEAGNFHKYPYNANGVGYPITFEDTTDGATLRINVTSGEKYYIRSANYYALRAWMTADANGNCVRKCASGDRTVIREIIEIQDGEAQLLITISESMPFSVIGKIRSIDWNPIAGKVIAFDGDSICEGRYASQNSYNGGGYAYLLSRRYGIDVINNAKGGATLATGTSASHQIAGSLASLPQDADIYCFDGGYNDWALGTPLGTLTDNYTDPVDTGTVIGAMESIFRYCLSTFVGKPVIFVITHKVQNSSYSGSVTFTQYHDAMVKCLEKYSIPFYDAFTKSGLNGWNSAQSAAFLTANSAGTPDGTHPNEAGYLKYYVGPLYQVLAENVGVTL